MTDRPQSAWSDLSSSGTKLAQIEAFRSEVNPADKRHPCAIAEATFFRRIWNTILVLLLLYVGTVLPYVVCFHHLKIGGFDEESGLLEASSFFVDGLFYIDLLLNFFFTYEDASGIEIFNLFLIAKHYLTGRFVLDVVACLPSQFWVLVFDELSDGGFGTSGVYKLTRLARLQRVSRLARMASLSRWVEQMVQTRDNVVLRWLRGVSSVRIVNFVGTLFWFVHILACGWYLCAAMHEDEKDTWVAQRIVDHTGATLLDSDPAVQWAHAMYFVLTVFTTVGFGDMSATTVGEIVYVSFTMLVGAVVHSIIVSEIIGIVTALDTEQKEAAQRLQLIDAFSHNTDLGDATRLQVKEWIGLQAKRGNLGAGYDREAMRKLLVDGTLPSDIIQKLPAQVFGGRLLKNHFLTALSHSTRNVPDRLILFISLAVHRRQCRGGEMVYRLDDHPFNLFLVDSGVFAYVVRATPAPPMTSSPTALKTESDKDTLTPSTSRRTGTTTLKGMPSEDLAPYKIFTAGSYFGDAELISKKPRRTTVRCETPEGVLLSLDTAEFEGLVDSFPQFRRVWFAEAARHGRAQRQALDSFKAKAHGEASLEERAVVFIQRWLKERKSRSALVSAIEGSSHPASPTVPSPVQARGGGEQGGDVQVLEAAVDTLREEMRSGIASLRVELLQELRREVSKGFEDLRRGQQDAIDELISLPNAMR